MFNKAHSLLFRYVASIVLCAFIFTLITPPTRTYAATSTVLNLPMPGTMVNLSPAYAPVLMKGLKVHPENPLLFDFIIDTGNTKLNPNDASLKTESEKLIKYFLATLTIPENDLWVNLSPYEKDRMIPDELGKTDLGADMLAQDYMLKQLTASLIYPEKELGKNFWNKIYAKAQQLYGTTEVPVNTFNKVWIVADKANVYVHDNTAFVVASHLKVMLEEDYVALNKNHNSATPQTISINIQQKLHPEKLSGVSTKAPEGANQTHSIASQIVRQIVLPEIEKEVNQGQNFAQLRQMFQAMILATWYKKNLKQALLNQVYTDKAKVNGVDAQDKTMKEKIYQRYLQAYKKGVFNYIKEDINSLPPVGRVREGVNKTIPRKYFSGGLTDMAMANVVGVNHPDVAAFAQSVTGADKIMFSVRATVQDAVMARSDSKEIEDMFRNFEKQGIDLSNQNLRRKAEKFAEETKRRAFEKRQEKHFEPTVEQALRPDAAMTAWIDALREKGFSETVLKNVAAKVIQKPEHRQVLELLASVGEQDLLNAWPLPGDRDDQKRAMLDQIADINNFVAGGFIAYKQTAREYFHILRNDLNPFAGARAEVPQGVDLTNPTEARFDHYTEKGIGHADQLGFVLVAGGIGDRLGALGKKLLEQGKAKVEIPIDPVADRSYLQHFSEAILSMQKAYNELNPTGGRPARIPLFIMTSDETHERTIQLFRENHNFGFKGLSIDPTPQQIEKGKIGQVVISRQKSVPTMRNSDAKFTTDPKNPLLLETKPHNHVDIHRLLAQTGVAEHWEKQGKTHFIFFQDTNGQAFNVIPAFVGVTMEEDYDGNILTVNRRPGEKVGCIVRMVSPNGEAQTYNVEYNQITGVLKSMGSTEQGFVDSEGNSLFPGNINILAVKAKTYNQILRATGGAFSEMLNLKDNDLERLKKTEGTAEFVVHPRLEAMMQDMFKHPLMKRTGFTKFGSPTGFMPTKNGFENALRAVAMGNIPESLPWAVGGYYRHQRWLLQEAGVDIDVEGESRFAFEGEYKVDLGTGGIKDVKGIPYRQGAYVSLPFWLPFQAENAFSGGRVSKRSVLSVQGEGHFKFKNLQLDGTLILNLGPGVEVFSEGLKVINKGWHEVPLNKKELSDPNTLIFDVMRGSKWEKLEQLGFNITEPGKYEIGSDGILKKIAEADQAMASEDKDWESEVKSGKIPRGTLATDIFNVSINGMRQGTTSLSLQQEGSDRFWVRLQLTPPVRSNKESQSKTLLLQGIDAEKKAREAFRAITAKFRAGFADRLASREELIRAFRAIALESLAKIKASDALPVPGVSIWDQDNAMNADQARVAANGGIDLNSRNLQMDEQGVKIDIKFDPAMIAQFQRGDFSGVRPVILNITPIPNILPLLGLAPGREEEQNTLAKAG